MAEEAKRVLNERLKEKKLATSRWSSGTNKVERLLGRELCVLAWAVEAAPKDLIPDAMRNWVGIASRGALVVVLDGGHHDGTAPTTSTSAGARPSGSR